MFASFLRPKESKKVSMAHVLPVPGFARTDAEPLLATVGNTPLLRLEKIPAEFPGVEIYAKAEYFNPGGSVKDRAALNMVLDGERSGKLNHNRTILDSTSGNTGIAYAMIGANRGYRVKLVLPGNASPERKRILKAYGAEMVFSDPAEGSDGAIRMVRKIYEADPDLLLLSRPVQQSGQLEGAFRRHRPRDHQADRRTAHALRHGDGDQRHVHGNVRGGCSATCPDVQCWSAQPSSGFHGLEGLKHMPTAIVPGFYDEQLADGNLWIETEDAYKMVRRLAREEGLLVGISSGCNVHAAHRWSRGIWWRAANRA